MKIYCFDITNCDIEFMFLRVLRIYNFFFNLDLH